jgi:transposase-like protein
MERWNKNVRDHETVMILAATFVIAADSSLRPRLKDEFPDLGIQMPTHVLGRANISSIAAAAGVNRETARRKLRDLEERGLVSRDQTGSVRIAPGVLQTDGARDAVLEQLEPLVRLVNDLIASGSLRVE